MPEFLFLKWGTRRFKISLGEIPFIRADKKHVAIVTAAKCYPSSLSIGEMENILPAKIFCRIHRSYIISLRHTDEFDNELVHLGKHKIPIGEQYKNVLSKAITVIDGNSNPFALSDDDIDKILDNINSIVKHPEPL